MLIMSTRTQRPPRAAAVAGYLALVAAASYVAVALTSERIAEVLGGQAFVAELLGDEVGPYPFALIGDAATNDTRVAWLAGLAVTLAVLWVLVAWATTSVRGVFLGTWLASTAAAAAGNVMAGWMSATQSALDADAALTLVYGSSLAHGIVWGFMTGWVLGLVALLLAFVLRRPEQTVEQSSLAPPVDESVDESVDQAPPAPVDQAPPAAVDQAPPAPRDGRSTLAEPAEGVPEHSVDSESSSRS